jgi:peptidoglycan/xylan/chitin deacetylase (PgdA/CDA1 family)
MKQELLCGLLVGTGVVDQIIAGQRRGTLKTLGWHRIGTPGEFAVCDPGTVDATEAQFARQLDFVASRFRTVGVQEILAAVQGGRGLPPGSIALTFDDAYREVVDRVLPALTSRGLRGIFFAPTAFIGGSRLFWWDRIAYLVDRTRRDRIALGRGEVIDLRSGRDAARSRLLRMVKDENGMDLEAFFRELEAATGVTLSADREAELAASTVCGWDDLARLREAGMDVESHSHEHRVLGTLAPDALLADLRTSRELIAARLGHDSRAIAYPVGHLPSGAVQAAVRRAGFSLGFTFATGVTSDPARAPLHVARAPMGTTLSFARFQAMLAFDSLSDRPALRRARAARAG